MRHALACIVIVLIFSTTNSALASWWLVRSSEGKCLVVNIEPTDQDKTVTKIGNEAYQSADQAERAPNGFARMQSQASNPRLALSKTWTSITS
jgi:hypothetical protein